MFNRKLIFLAVILTVFLPVLAFAGVIDLPQTGQTKCYDTAGAEIPCAGTGQDGEIQAGVLWPNPRFTVGTGTETDCVTDNLTGLMWPKKGNLAGVSPMTWNSAIDYANNLTLCGYSDWRLPNVNELESLVNADVSNTATWLNGAAQGFTNVQPYYWSSTTRADATIYAWVVWMVPGYMDKNSKGYSYGGSVWPVRSGQQNNPDPIYPANIWKTGQTTNYTAGDDGDLERGVAWPDPRFIVNSDCVTDNLTGLMWARNANLAGYMNWNSALDYTNNLTLCGYSDWRLPNREELRSLIDYSNYNPTLPSSHPFTYVQSYYYWSSTTDAYDTSHAWVVVMLRGEVHGLMKEDYYYQPYAYVWPVRAGTLDNLVILTVTKSGAGTGTVTSNPTGINCGSDCSETYNSGAVVTLTATPDANSTFTGWSGDADCSDGVVAMDADKTCTATFTITPVNVPPVANAGTDQAVEATSPSGASVTLNGSLSSDPDGDALSFIWTWSSGGASGISPAITLPLGVHNITLQVSDGQATATDDVTIMVQDTAPPLIACPANQIAEATSSAGAVVNYSPATATDAVSTPTIVYSHASGTVFPLGTTQVMATATDSAGNSAFCSFDVAVQDTTPPTIATAQSPLPNANGWNNTDVTVSFTATDMVSTATCSPVSVTVSTEGANQIVNTTCTDQAGNSATASHTVNIDKTAPVITITGVTDGSAYILGCVPTANFTAEDALSGIATSNGTLTGGNSNGVGGVIYTVTATDMAWNNATQTANLSVTYNFIGFLQPINNDGSSVFKLGSTAPIKYQLTDCNGDAITTAVGTLAVFKVTDAVTGTTEEMSVDASGSSNTDDLFRYSAPNYIYNLSTKPYSQGTFRLQATLDDGTVHTVNISLKAK